MTCHIAAQPSLRCPTVTTSHQPRRAQCGGGECCRLQDDLYCFLGKLQESTIARAVTRHGHTHLVCRWSVVLSDALLLSYTFCIVAVLLDSLDMNLRLFLWCTGTECDVVGEIGISSGDQGAYSSGADTLVSDLYCPHSPPQPLFNSFVTLPPSRWEEARTTC